MKTKISEYILKNSTTGVRTFSTQEIAEQFQLSRSRSSFYLNALWNSGFLIKINSRPVSFLLKEKFESDFGAELRSDSFDSIEQLLVKKHTFKDFEKMIGYQYSLKSAIEKAKAVFGYPPNGLPIMIEGDTGVGKSYFARLLFEYGQNEGLIDSDAKFVHLNCSDFAHNPELLTANLFGHKKGAYTGADCDNHGLIHEANNGVLFLDEIHCLSPESQEKLFVVMDTHKYRPLGENTRDQTTNARFLFATTEEPEKVFLKTFLRRIPVRLSLPSLKERTLKERRLLLGETLQQEETKIGAKITLNKNIYQILLNYDFPGNVGELQNVVRIAVINAFYKSVDKKEIRLSTIHLPEAMGHYFDLSPSLLSSDFDYKTEISVAEIVDLSQEHSLLSILSQSIYNYSGENEALNQLLVLSKQIETHYQKELLKDYQVLWKNKQLYLNFKKVISYVSERFKVGLQQSEVDFICLIIFDYLSNKDAFSSFSEDNTEQLQVIFDNVKQELPSSLTIGENIAKQLNSTLNVEVSQTIVLFLAMIISTLHKQRYDEKRLAVIIAHGYATATSIADTVNNLLDEFIFEGIDMPLTVSTSEVIRSINTYIETVGEFKDLILLVDMGSLEQIYREFTKNKLRNIVIINNINTKLAFNIGELIKQEKTLDEIVKEALKNNQIHHQLILKEQKPRAIICSCASGKSTAKRLGKILENSLSFLDQRIDIILVDYQELLVKKAKHDIFEKYEVLFVVGTLNPTLENMTFISIDQMIMNDGFELFCSYFRDLLNEEELSCLEQNLLKNFSLTNIISSLTILNPSILIEQVASSLETLQKKLGISFSTNTSFGLYVHICCLIERLVKKENMDIYETEKLQLSDEKAYLFTLIEEAFEEVYQYYDIFFPEEEMEYLTFYIEKKP